MVYLNNDNNLYYTDAEFTNIANGIVGDILYVNGVPTLYKNNSDGLFYTDQGFTNLANGASGLSGSNSAGNDRWFINGQQTDLHEDGSGSWNGKNYRAGEADFTGTYAGGLGLPDGFYVNGVKTTLDLWGGHGVWNNKIYGSAGYDVVNDKLVANETHLNGFTSYIQTDNYGGFTQLTDLTDVDFSSVVSVAGANFAGLDLSGLDFSRFTDWSGVQFGCSAKVVGADFSGVDFTNNGTSLCFDDASGADFSGARIVDISSNTGGFAGVNFSNAIIAGDISWKNFSGANLAGADFSGTPYYPMGQPGSPQFDGATDVTGTIFPVNFVGLVNGTWRFGSSVTNLDYAIIQNADLTGVDFSNVTSMVGADFSGSNFTGVDFSEVTSIAGANFSDATLTGANFSNVTNMEGANFSGATLTGATFPSSISGYYGNVYFINGQATTLDSSGTGFWDNKAYYNGSEQPNGHNGYFYYINNVETNLDSNGSGFWNGMAYVYGTENPTGPNGYFYYIDNVETTLDAGGNGIWNNQPYWNGSKTNLDGANFSHQDLSTVDFSEVTSVANAYFMSANLTGADFSNVTNMEGANFSSPFGATILTGVDFSNVTNMEGANFSLTNLTGVTFPSNVSGSFGYGVYLINGQVTTLDSDGSGFWSDKAYFGGSEQPTGWNGYFYYINNVETTLDSNGDGEWNGGTYIGGVLQGGGGGGSENTLTKIQGNAKFYGKVKFGV